MADEELREKFHESRKFGDTDNAIYPYRRLLNGHGTCSYRTAKLKNWICLEENPQDLFYLSDFMSVSGDDHDEGDKYKCSALSFCCEVNIIFCECFSFLLIACYLTYFHSSDFLVQ